MGVTDSINPNPAVVIVPVITGCYVAYYLQGGATPFDPDYNPVGK